MYFSYLNLVQGFELKFSVRVNIKLQYAYIVILFDTWGLMVVACSSFISNNLYPPSSAIVYSTLHACNLYLKNCCTWVTLSLYKTCTLFACLTLVAKVVNGFVV